MKHVIGLLALLFLSLSASGCVDREEYANTPMDNFEALWKIIDERYCFLEMKGIDWNKVHDDYAAKITPKMSSFELFDVLAAMLYELKDGHVNLYTAFNTSRYAEWFEGNEHNRDDKTYQENYDGFLLDRYYLNYQYQIASGMKYKRLVNESKSIDVGYIGYPSFSSGLSETGLNYILTAFQPCRGIIIDIRNNGGGMSTNALALASRFIDQPICSGYVSHKLSPAHDDFSSLYPIPLTPSRQVRYPGNVVLLVNRHTYSAANEFVSIMKGLPRVTVVGTITGGGCGLPISSEIPCGWSVRFSASRFYNAHKELTEFGIEPDIPIVLDQERALNEHIDTMLDKAIEVANQ